MSDAAQMETLPPRTWRHWWRQKPSLFRIGVCGCGLFVVVHTLLAVRMAIGWREDAEIAALRKRGHMVQYSWEAHEEFFEGHQLILAGLMGRSCRNVSEIFLNDFATDAELDQIGRRFLHVKRLRLDRTEITSKGIVSLARCRKLEYLDLRDTDVDDSGVKSLAEHSSLTSLDLAGTLITDVSLSYLQRLPALRFVDLSWTGVTPSSIELLRQSCWDRGGTIDAYGDDTHQDFQVSVRWADGERRERFGGFASYTFKSRPTAGEHRSEELTDSMPYLGQQGHLGRSVLREKVSMMVDSAMVDCEFVITLSLGGYDSEPVACTVNDGTLSTDHIEFRMPVTRAAAQRAEDQRRRLEEMESENPP